VNIAFIYNNKPAFGIVYAPVYDTIFLGGVNIEPCKLQGGKSTKSISVRNNIDLPIQIAVSRSHPSKEMDDFISQFNEYNLHSMGSSLKICSVADGTVHLYPRLGPTMEWDTAASHAIVNAAGGELFQYGTYKPLKYNKRDLLNPKFIATSFNIIKSLAR
jgi:3'(2'), 5'-bisphosphate nucleotidase